MVSCHVERPLDTAVWDRYRDLCIARPGWVSHRLAAATAGRRRGRGAVRRARPRGDGARAVRAPHALDVADARAADRRRRPGGAGAARGTLAARARARAALLLRRRLVHRCGSDERRRRPGVRRFHRDARRGRRSCRPTRRAPSLDAPAWIRLDDGRRVFELPSTHSLGSAARALAGDLPRAVHVHFHDYELLDRKRRAALLARAAAARAAAAAGRAGRGRDRARGGVGGRMRRLTALAALAVAAHGLRLGLELRHEGRHRPRRREPVPHHRPRATASP